MKVFLKI